MRSLGCWNVLLSALLALAAPGCARATYYVAVGAEDEIPGWNGGCEHGTARPAELVRFVSPGNDYFVALGEGDVRIECREGKLELRLRRLASLQIEGPDRLAVGDRGYYSVRGYDAAGHALGLGIGVTWEESGPIHPRTRCSHMLGSCGAAWQTSISADAAGSATLTASVAGMATSRTITISARPAPPTP